MLTLEDYDDNTHDPLTSLNVTFMVQTFDEVTNDWIVIPDQPDILRTLGFGRCLHYTILKKEVIYNFRKSVHLSIVSLSSQDFQGWDSSGN